VRDWLVTTRKIADAQSCDRDQRRQDCAAPAGLDVDGGARRGRMALFHVTDFGRWEGRGIGWGAQGGARGNPKSVRASVILFLTAE
jgi:hypothetical protein